VRKASSYPSRERQGHSTEHDEPHHVLSFVVPFAQDLLKQHGEFLPFAAIVSPAGECWVRLPSSETADERPIREILTEALKENAAPGECRAVARHRRAP
jgi:hypothetical protein